MTKALVKLRALGLSQSALAKKLKITQGAVSRLLNEESGGGGSVRSAAFREFGIPPTDWDEPATPAEEAAS